MPCAHAGPGLRDLVGQNCVFDALLHAPGIPLIGQFLASLNSLQSLIDPLTGIALFQISFQCPFNGQLQVHGFLDEFPTDLGQPEFERLGFGGRDCLDNPKKLFRVGNVCQTLFSVSSGHLQTVTICHGFIAFGFQTLFELAPICCGIDTISKYVAHTHNRKIPFFLLHVTSDADALEGRVSLLLQCTDGGG